jgi:hypothetical protein
MSEESKNRFVPDTLPTLNRHFRYADQILYGQKRRKKKTVLP